MTLSLADFPSEILAQITSYLSALEIVQTLRYCGNSALDHRMRHGGVTLLDFEVLESQHSSRTVFIQSLQLRSFIVRKLHCSAKHAKKLLFNLSPNLRHLVLIVADPKIVESLREDLDFDDSSNTLCVTASKYQPWIVSESYPHLETLRICQSNNGLLYDVFFATQFVNGLPSSLTNLEVSMPPSLGLVRLLPPNLTRLGLGENVMRLAGSNTVPLTLTIRSHYRGQFAAQAEEHALVDAEKAANQEKSEKEGEKEENSIWRKWTAYPASNDILLPLGLLELKLWACAGVPLQRLPPTLTKLDIQGVTGKEVIDPLELLNTLPPTVTCLRALFFVFKEDLLWLKDSPQPRPALKTLFFEQARNSMLSHTMMTKMMELAPNLETFRLECYSSGGQHQLKIDDLKLLPNVRVLSACFSPEIFVATKEMPSVLGAYLPYLNDLEPQNVDLLPVDFATLPPTVTRFHCRGRVEPINLHLVPSSVTDFWPRYLIDSGPELSPAFFPPTPPPAALTSTSPLTIEDGNFSLFDVSQGACIGADHYHFKHYPTIDASSGQLESRLMLVEANRYEGGISALYLTPEHLPESVTSLSLTRPHSSFLPHLTVLKTSTCISKINLALYPALTDLSVSIFGTGGDFKNQSCPPGLIRFSYDSEGEIPDSFLPLSPKLQELRTFFPLRPLEALNGLSNLKFLDCGSIPPNTPLLTWLHVLPTSVTHIMLPLDRFDPNEDERAPINILAERFSNLRLLTLTRDAGRHSGHLSSADLSLSAYRYIMEKLPHVEISNLKLKNFFLQHSPAILLAREGVALGSLVLPTSPSGKQKRGVKTALERWAFEKSKEDYSTKDIPYSLSVDHWNEMAHFFSPNSPLSLGIILENDEQVVIWPAGLTKLNVQSTKHFTPLLSLLNLPNTILSLSLDNFTIPDYLPASLTSFKAEGQTNTISTVLSWPPNLRVLACAIRNDVLTDNLKALPTTLEVLGLRGAVLSRNQIELFPPHLKRYRGQACPLDPTQMEDWIAFLRRRKIKWVKITSLTDELVQLFGEDDSIKALNALSPKL